MASEFDTRGVLAMIYGVLYKDVAGVKFLPLVQAMSRMALL
eukprot:CAMPEP_0182801846 /NCGR_PEP_ID=MMETSP0006_2-20121128/3166_1 /TAXON_ID=97485 /ORGANISM="Prymnesium parvum, Strain Texoma1" /LENGTH=40 /DNA_ID= /DNA_START= /DNA_END= /DNA_ORIENTATION=